jgi:hypothetical protein
MLAAPQTDRCGHAEAFAYKIDRLTIIVAHIRFSPLTSANTDDAPGIHPVAFAQACSAASPLGASFRDSCQIGTVRA